MPATPTTPTAGGDASFRKEHAQLLADNERMRARLDALESTMQALASARSPEVARSPAGRGLNHAGSGPTEGYWPSATSSRCFFCETSKREGGSVNENKQNRLDSERNKKLD